MKQVILFLFVFSISITTVFAQQKKVALMSIFVDKLTTSGMNDDQRNKSGNESDIMNYDSIIANFKTRFFETYAPQLPLEFIPEETVINAPGYSDLGSSMEKQSRFQRFAVAKGYVKIDSKWSSKDKEAINNAFKILPADVDFIMITYLSFSVTNSSRVNNVQYSKINAYVKMKIIDREGKTVVSISEGGKSEDELAAVTHSGWTVTDYTLQKVLSFQALDKLYADLEKDLPKDKAKIEKKITKWEKKQAKK